jgi:DNA-binding PadR family transcriptional regulator
MQRTPGTAKTAARIAAQELEEQLAPMHSAVKWALLGLVIERPDHGYELALRFREAYGGALALSDASYVYRALDSLERREWIQALADQQGGRAQKTRYRPTSAGIASYQDHLVEQMMRAGDLAQLHLRKLAVFARAPELALGVIERMEELCTASENPLPEQSRRSPEGNDPRALARRLQAQAQRLALTATLEWLHVARCEIQALAGEPAGSEAGAWGNQPA